MGARRLTAACFGDDAGNDREITERRIGFLKHSANHKFQVSLTALPSPFFFARVGYWLARYQIHFRVEQYICLLSTKAPPNEQLKNRRSTKLIRYGNNVGNRLATSSEKWFPLCVRKIAETFVETLRLRKLLRKLLFSIRRIPSKSLWRWKVLSFRINSAVMWFPPTP